ncbi:alkaline phosphatase D family protein [Proteiniphilum sp. UBA5510]|jgi:hypothetical protein|uniref:alkaline phosphatase D family protein n=1 Tax=Proteiniphilum sp. UBA5510 TaxID=1947286 RepID=UPI00257B926C|nr:alkaline phosphatase D family protein [Proteiniphilum sp. UBA5510]
MKFKSLLIFVVSLTLVSCSKKNEFSANFENINNRIWIGKEFWSIPLEDWKIEDGKMQCIGSVPQSRVNLLTHILSDETGEFEASVKVGLIKANNIPGSAGLILGIYDEEDADVKSLCYFGKGIPAGISLQGFAFLKDQRAELPENFDFSEATISVSGNDKQLEMKVSDKNGNGPDLLSCKIEGIQGLVAVANNINIDGNKKSGNSHFSFDDIKLSGSKVTVKQENAFGPILWTMYTLSKGTVKMMALLPPIGVDDNQIVNLQLKKNETWETVASESLEPDSRTVVFKLDKWDAGSDVAYRVEYNEKGINGNETPNYYEGIIRRDPVDRPLKFGGLTCQNHIGFPYTPLVQNLTVLNPDILYFSGDQIYEGNGGYPIKRKPEDLSIINYLGKYYMFGWAFGDLMRNVPTICTPDDHDVFQGNLWGEGGIAKPGGLASDDSGGFTQSVKMVNVVNRTNCGQLPDPYDPTPVEQGMSVWYSDLTYGRVSFAIISDRIFKTGPEKVADWDGRKDHMKVPRNDLSFLDKKGVEMIGKRQTDFLNQWITEWEGADMKVLLSQTLFANVATHHGSVVNYLYGDLDSGGWPKSDRDKIIRVMRKAAVFHINGDQHIPSLVQYGLNDFCDAGWSYCTPAIAVGYQRWFLPDELGIPVNDRPDHGYDNTGKYTDAFGNKNYVYAIGNPGKIADNSDGRYSKASMRSSGFGMITFNQKTRSIHIDAWRFKANVENPNPVRDQFPGWPLEISQFDNLGSGANNVLPEIRVNKSNQVLQIWNERTGELVQSFRINGNTVKSKLHEPGTFSIKIGDNGKWQSIRGLSTKRGENNETVNLEIQ